MTARKIYIGPVIAAIVIVAAPWIVWRMVRGGWE